MVFVRLMVYHILETEESKRGFMVFCNCHAFWAALFSRTKNECTPVQYPAKTDGNCPDRFRVAEVKIGNNGISF